MSTPEPRDPQRRDFVVVANRLPVDRVVDAAGVARWQRSPGGLVTALAPVMRRRGGAWVGWVGSPDEEVAPFSTDGLDLVPVPLSSGEVEAYYEGFSNATLWPIYHDVIVAPAFHREWWDADRLVNRRFAERAAAVAEQGGVVWVQDYQLQLVPAMLRDLRPDLRIGFFLHIPFPPAELFAQLPWRRQLLDGLLGADLVGFQRAGAAANFLDLATRFTDAHRVGPQTVSIRERPVHADAFPISIDVEEIEGLAHDPAVEARADELRRELGKPEHLLLGVDRLDYTKGIRHRVKAFEELLEDGSVTPECAVLVQVAVPTRERVQAYQELRDEIELAVGRLNGDHGGLGVTPLHYLHAGVDRGELVALMRAADVMVVTPLRDGMNLVAKEYVAARVDGRGVLVLSEFAGAADQLTDALLVNPHDIDGLKRTLLQAIDMPEAEQERRMRSLRAQVRSYDIARWAGSFLEALGRAGAPSAAPTPA
jgi:trehalose 6-phosphate synthase